MAIQFIDLKAQYQALKGSIDARIDKVLDHGQYIMGPEVAELEGKLAEYTGAKHCITVASGTEALLIALMALDVKPGDEVITTPFTFVATAEVIALLGATPSSSISNRTPATSTPARSKPRSPRRPAPSCRSASTVNRRTWTKSMPSPPGMA